MKVILQTVLEVIFRLYLGYIKLYLGSYIDDRLGCITSILARSWVATFTLCAGYIKVTLGDVFWELYLGACLWGVIFRLMPTRSPATTSTARLRLPSAIATRQSPWMHTCHNYLYHGDEAVAMDAHLP